MSATPLRVPFAGGLTDLKEYVVSHGGATISTTIDKKIYVGIKPNTDGYFSLKYLDVHEKVNVVDDIRHDHIRETLRISSLDNTPVDVYIMADLNAESGLGSSGALTVGLLNAMHALNKESVSKTTLLEEASHIEVELLGGASGYHDMAIAAVGGLNLIEYATPGIMYRQVRSSPGAIQGVFDRLLFLYNGRHYKSKPSLDILAAKIDEAGEVLSQMKSLAYETEKALMENDLEGFGKCIQKQQDLKQQLPGMFTDGFVTDVVARVRKHGAYVQLPGGKIGSFLMVFCPDGQQEVIKREFPDMHEVAIGPSEDGSRITEI